MGSLLSGIGSSLSGLASDPLSTLGNFAFNSLMGDVGHDTGGMVNSGNTQQFNPFAPPQIQQTPGFGTAIQNTYVNPWASQSTTTPNTSAFSWLQG